VSADGAVAHVHDAWVEGRLSSGQVDAVVANVTDRTAELFADGEAERVDAIAGLSVEHTAVVMRHWAAAARDRLQPRAAAVPGGGHGVPGVLGPQPPPPRRRGAARRGRT